VTPDCRELGGERPKTARTFAQAHGREHVAPGQGHERPQLFIEARHHRDSMAGTADDRGLFGEGGE